MDWELACYKSTRSIKENENCPRNLGNSKKDEQTNTKVAFTSEEQETMIAFYQNSPALWNHAMLDYRGQNIWCSLIQKLHEEFDKKFTEHDIKKEWNSLLTCYRHKRQAEKVSRSSGAGIVDDAFLESTPEPDLSMIMPLD